MSEHSFEQPNLDYINELPSFLQHVEYIAEDTPFRLEDFALTSLGQYGRSGQDILLPEQEYFQPLSQSPYDKAQDFGKQIDRGYMPNLGNGFAFVIDTRPESREDDHISAREYTEYFSKGQIPVAAAGHRLRDHDLGHISSYQTMFRSTSLAEFVRATATDALEDEEQCKAFTRAMDGLGDSMRNIEDDLMDTRGIDLSNVRGVTYNLERMQILRAEQQAADPNAYTETVKQIRQDLRIPYYRQHARLPRCEYTHFSE